MSMLNNMGLGNLIRSCNSTVSNNMQFVNGIQQRLESGTPSFTGQALQSNGAPPRILQYMNMNQYPYLPTQVTTGINLSQMG